ncbi:MAG TPA: cupin-like domain-containing protein [Polyangiaceae bacterium]|nr:cupin-like domain-containing protein [Polyangiaceae bacterium]
MSVVSAAASKSRSLTRFEPVERVENISAAAFVANYLAKNRPVVVREHRDADAAYRRWSPDDLARRFGDIDVKVSGDFFTTIGAMKLRDYMLSLERYEQRPAHEFSEESPVPYLRETPSADRTPRDFDRVAFRALRHEWARRPFMPRNLYFRPLHLLSSRPNVRRYPGFGIFVSPRGALTRYHVDIENDSNLLTQVHGVKRGFLFAPAKDGPATRSHSFAGRGNLQSILAGRAPDYSPYRPLEFELHPGDSVLLPKGWGHEVFTLSASVSLTYNFVHWSELNWAWIKFWLRGRNLENEPMRRLLR